MKYVLVFVLLLSGITDPVTKIAKSNKLKREAKTAFDNADYEKAVASYILLLDSMDANDEVARLNLANAAYLLSYGGENMGLMSDISSGKTKVQDTAALNAISEELRYFDIADSNYKDLKDANEPTVASSALNQMGIISYKQSEQSPDERESFIQSSLSNFKNALKRNPQNESARYNYELLKKLKRQQEEQQQQQDQENQDQENKDEQNKDQENKDQENKDKQDQENKDKQDQENQEQQDQENQDKENQDQENKDQQNDEQQPQEEDPMQKIKDKLKEMNISPEKAEMILEAMKNNEIQYVQQNKRKASKRKRSDKPDW